MKKVVNGQVYDTDMADAVASWKEENHVAGVKVAVYVKLHRKHVLKKGVAPEEATKVSSWGSVSTVPEKIDKAKGEFFLSFETGSWDEESKRIVPVSDEQAKEIVEKRCSFDDYVSLFGDPRGVVLTVDAVKKAVEQQRMRDREEKSQVVSDLDTAKERVSYLEERIRELENR